MAIKARKARLYPPIKMEEGLRIGLDDIEWERIVDRLGRAPNHFEASIFASLWSETVSNKSSASLLQSIETSHEDIIRVSGSELGMIKVSEDQFLTLRVINNNAQTKVESHYAAQTAIDSSISELSALGAIPIGILNLLRFGSHDSIKNQHSFQAAVEGIGAFCSRAGVPVVGGELYFHKGYNHSSMVNSAVVGLIDGSNISETNDVPVHSPMLYIGAKTGRDLLQSRKGVPAIKMSDPLLANRMTCACTEAIQNNVVREIISVGSGGIAVACFNISKRIKKPIMLDIDRIPLRGENFEPLEIVLSETSDRILVIINKNKHRELNQILHKWDLDSIRVGEVNDSDGLEFYWNHYLAADIPFQFALGGFTQKTYEVVKFPPMLKRSANANLKDQAPKKKRKVVDDWSLVREVSLASGSGQKDRDIPCPSDLDDVWLDLLANPNLCSRSPVYKMFDQIVGARTFIPAGSDSAVIRLISHSFTSKDKTVKKNLSSKGAIAVTLDANSLYVSMDPYLGTVQTIAESMRNLAAVGARPTGLSYCLNYGSPQRYQDICDLAESIRGLGDACKIWNIPILSRQISLYNGSEAHPTLPTPSILCAGVLEDINESCQSGFRAKGDIILLIGKTHNEIGCSEYASYVHKYINRLVPDIDFELEKNTCELIVELVNEGLLCSAHDLSAGGLAIALTECCMGRKTPIGAIFNIYPQSFDTANGPIPLRPDAALFSETSARFLVSCTPEHESKIKEICKEASIPITGQGVVGGRSIIIEGAALTELALSTTYKLWAHRLESLLGQGGEETSGF